MPTTNKQRMNENIKDTCIMLGFSVSAVLLGLLFNYLNLQETNIVLVNILACIGTASLTNGYWYGIGCSVLCLFTFNYFFVGAAQSFDNFSAYHAISIVIMFAITIFTSIITSRVKKNERIAQIRAENTELLYHLTVELSECSSMTEAIDITVNFIREHLKCKCAYWPYDDKGMPEKSYTLINEDGTADTVEVEWYRDVQKTDQKSDQGYLIGNHYYEWLLKGAEKTYGVVGCPISQCEEMSRSEIVLLSNLVEAASLTMDRIALQNEREKISQEKKDEQYRNNFLRSISHDLRTPLAGIIGTADILQEMVKGNPEAEQLAANIHKESNWLFDLVQNILSLTRLQNGKLQIRRDIEVVEDVINAAIEAIRIRYPERKVIFTPPVQIFTAPMDPKLIQQVLINLIDNANKHSAPEGVIRVEMKENADKSISISVKDEGTGIPEQSFEHLFDAFYTTHAKDTDIKRGFGLGLPICDAVMKAHHGTIKAENNSPDPGATFTITLIQD